jgi:hypothetical protein
MDFFPGGFPTGIACAIAEVGRMDFYNARKWYPQPPPELAEPHRLFAEADLIGLSIFGRLRAGGLTVAGACAVVGLVVEEVRASPRLKTIRVGWDFDGQRYVVLGPPRGQRPPGVLFELVMDLAEIRERVRTNIVEWSDLEMRAAERTARETGLASD